mmetsp:Transcript_26442/g.72672  ORF Transcript_26442/g.72672 Transcript_26442/m.72672 type:complete len:96 (+) Transcript_26442:2-289(+)
MYAPVWQVRRLQMKWNGRQLVMIVDSRLNRWVRSLDLQRDIFKEATLVEMSGVEDPSARLRPGRCQRGSVVPMDVTAARALPLADRPMATRKSMA